MRDAFDIQPYGPDTSDTSTNYGWSMKDKFDNYPLSNRWDGTKPAMYETTESRYATELVNSNNITKSSTAMTLTVEYKGGAFGSTGSNFKNGFCTIYMIVNGSRKAIAMQDEKGNWFKGSNISLEDANAKTISVTAVALSGITATVTISCTDTSITNIDALATTYGVSFAAVGRYDSENDLTGKYLGEVELQMRDYHFRPRPITLGVTWTELTELVLDTSFGLSAEEMLMDSAAQEIKKSLDFQAVKYASDVQKTYASENFIQFDASYNSSGTGAKDSYWHQAQLVNQAVGHIEDNMLNAFNRGGVTAIVGGPKACRYLELNEGWSSRGSQPKIGGHKVGELNGKTWDAVVKVA